ncbi:MAG: DUF4215 domain-containing protein [Myxococcota bacterium]
MTWRRFHRVTARLAGSTAWALLLLACGSRTELTTPPPLPPPPVCGDGVVEGDEQCDLGPDNREQPALELVVAGVASPIMPLDNAVTAVGFYDYRSESSQTGLEEPDLCASFLHRDLRSGVLSLGSHLGIDEDASGITLDYGAANMIIEGLPSGATLVVADEPTEEVFDFGDTVEGRWEFWRNSDGLMVEGLPFPGDWEVTVAVSFFAGITRWSYFDGQTGRPVAQVLDPSEPIVLRAWDEPSACRTDCRLPACGDGFVDGGEVCDDGNRVGGDGCSADCLAVSP